jgi:hypothetical protein
MAEGAPTFVIYRRNRWQWMVLGVPPVLLVAGFYGAATHGYGLWGYAATVGLAAFWLAAFWAAPKLSPNMQVQLLQISGSRLQGETLNFFGKGLPFDYALDETVGWEWRDVNPLVTAGAALGGWIDRTCHVLFSAQGARFSLSINVQDQVDFVQLRHVAGRVIDDMLAAHPTWPNRIDRPH